MIDGSIALEATKMHADRAVPARPDDVLQCLVHTLECRQHDPAQSATAATTAIGQEPVVGTCQRQLDGRRLRRETEEQARKQNMHVHALLIHRLEPFSGLGHRQSARFHLALGETLDHVEIGARVELPVDDPHRRHGMLDRRHQDTLFELDCLRPMHAFALGEMLPDRGGFNQVCIGVDNAHDGFQSVS